MHISERNKIYLEGSADMAFFYGDVLPYRVIASSAEHARIKTFTVAGKDITDMLGVDKAIFRNAFTQSEKPVALRSKHGLGIIFPLFYISSGLYTYVHINARRTSIGRALNYLETNQFCTVIGETSEEELLDEDIPTCRAIEEAMRSFGSIEDYTADDYMRAASNDRFDTGFEKSLNQMMELVLALADFCGLDNVKINGETGSESYASAKDMRTLISTLLVCFSVAKTYAIGEILISLCAKDGIWCVDTEFVCRDKGQIATDALRYLELTADVTGMKFFCLKQSAPKPEGKRGKFLSVKLVSVFTSNPDIGVAWDVKARQIIEY